MEWLKEVLNQLAEGEDKERIVSDAMDQIKKGIGIRFVAKDDFNKKNNLAKDLKEQMKEKEELYIQQNSELEKLKDAAGVTDDLKDQIEKLKTNNTQALSDLKEKNTKELENLKVKMEKQEFDYALDLSIREYDPKNVKAVKALLDIDIIKKGSDGKLIGLKEQMDNLKETDDYLFKVTQSKPKDSVPPANPLNPGSESNGIPDFSNMTDKEYFRFLEQQNK